MAKAQRIKTARVSPKPMPGDRHALKLGVEGDGVSPSSFDVVRTLTFVHAFVSVIDALADGEPLGLTGLGIAPGSTAFCFDAPEADRARVRSMATETQRFVRYEHEAPRGVRSKLADLKAALSHLPPSYRPFVETQGPRSFIPRVFEKPPVYRETTTMRMTVLSAGGKAPRVRVSTNSISLLSLQTTRSLAKRAGAALYKDIEAVVTLFSEGDTIVDGELHDFEIVDDIDPKEEIRRWSEWLAEAGKEWEDVDDVDRELGRGGDA